MCLTCTDAMLSVCVTFRQLKMCHRDQRSLTYTGVVSLPPYSLEVTFPHHVVCERDYHWFTDERLLVRKAEEGAKA